MGAKAEKPTKVLSLREREEGRGVDRASGPADELADRKCGRCGRGRWQDTGSVVEGCLCRLPGPFRGTIEARRREGSPRDGRDL